MSIKKPEIPIHPTVKDKLDAFYNSKKIPHLIFHGSSGTGKRTIVQEFLHKIYQGDKAKMKSNIMFVNCAHGKGIKFIREELKFFAKSNIQFNCGVLFKIIVLLNADNLTIDAQSALRRCIELFSNNTRFFIIVENKHKLLNPILSRFCEIYVPEYTDTDGHIINLHQYNLCDTYGDGFQCDRHIDSIMRGIPPNPTYYSLANLATHLYESGFSTLNLVDWVKRSDPKCDPKCDPHCDPNENGYSNPNGLCMTDTKKTDIVMRFHEIKHEYRCEKLLLLYMLDMIYMT